MASRALYELLREQGALSRQVGSLAALQPSEACHRGVAVTRATLQSLASRQSLQKACRLVSTRCVSQLFVRPLDSDSNSGSGSDSDAMCDEPEEPETQSEPKQESQRVEALVVSARVNQCEHVRLLLHAVYHGPHHHGSHAGSEGDIRAEGSDVDPSASTLREVRFVANLTPRLTRSDVAGDVHAALESHGLLLNAADLAVLLVFLATLLPTSVAHLDLPDVTPAASPSAASASPTPTPTPAHHNFTPTRFGESTRETAETTPKPSEIHAELPETPAKSGEATAKFGEVTAENGEATAENGEIDAKHGEIDTKLIESAQQSESTAKQSESAVTQSESAAKQRESTSTQSEAILEAIENGAEAPVCFASDLEQRLLGKSHADLVQFCLDLAGTDPSLLNEVHKFVASTFAPRENLAQFDQLTTRQGTVSVLINAMLDELERDTRSKITKITPRAFRPNRSPSTSKAARQFTNQIECLLRVGDVGAFAAASILAEAMRCLAERMEKTMFGTLSANEAIDWTHHMAPFNATFLQLLARAPILPQSLWTLLMESRKRALEVIGQEELLNVNWSTLCRLLSGTPDDESFWSDVDAFLRFFGVDTRHSAQNTSDKLSAVCDSLKQRGFSAGAAVLLLEGKRSLSISRFVVGHVWTHAALLLLSEHLEDSEIWKVVLDAARQEAKRDATLTKQWLLTTMSKHRVPQRYVDSAALVLVDFHDESMGEAVCRDGVDLFDAYTRLLRKRPNMEKELSAISRTLLDTVQEKEEATQDRACRSVVRVLPPTLLTSLCAHVPRTVRLGLLRNVITAAALDESRRTDAWSMLRELLREEQARNSFGTDQETAEKTQEAVEETSDAEEGMIDEDEEEREQSSARKLIDVAALFVKNCSDTSILREILEHTLHMDSCEKILVSIAKLKVMPQEEKRVESFETRRKLLQQLPIEKAPIEAVQVAQRLLLHSCDDAQELELFTLLRERLKSCDNMEAHARLLSAQCELYMQHENSVACLRALVCDKASAVAIAGTLAAISRIVHSDFLCACSGETSESKGDVAVLRKCEQTALDCIKVLSRTLPSVPEFANDAVLSKLAHIVAEKWFKSASSPMALQAVKIAFGDRYHLIQKKARQVLMKPFLSGMKLAADPALTEERRKLLILSKPRVCADFVRDLIKLEESTEACLVMNEFILKQQTRVTSMHESVVRTCVDFLKYVFTDVCTLEAKDAIWEAGLVPCLTYLPLLWHSCNVNCRGSVSGVLPLVKLLKEAHEVWQGELSVLAAPLCRGLSAVMCRVMRDCEVARDQKEAEARCLKALEIAEKCKPLFEFAFADCSAWKQAGAPLLSDDFAAAAGTGVFSIWQRAPWFARVSSKRAALLGSSFRHRTTLRVSDFEPSLGDKRRSTRDSDDTHRSRSRSDYRGSHYHRGARRGRGGPRGRGSRGRGGHHRHHRDLRDSHKRRRR